MNEYLPSHLEAQIVSAEIKILDSEGHYPLSDIEKNQNIIIWIRLLAENYNGVIYSTMKYNDIEEDMIMQVVDGEIRQEFTVSGEGTYKILFHNEYTDENSNTKIILHKEDDFSFRLKSLDSGKLILE